MKHSIIGLIGGMSWHSTMVYYQTLNAAFYRESPASQNAEVILISVDGSQIERWLKQHDFDSVEEALVEKLQILQSAGATIALVACNSVHVVSNNLEKSIDIPLIHIADPVATELSRSNYKTVGLLATLCTQSNQIYEKALRKLGIKIVYPSANDAKTLNKIIFEDLCVGSSGRNHVVEKMAHDLITRGAEAVVLGCTELSIVFEQKKLGIRLYDSAKIHASTVGRIAALGEVSKIALEEY